MIISLSIFCFGEKFTADLFIQHLLRLGMKFSSAVTEISSIPSLSGNRALICFQKLTGNWPDGYEFPKLENKNGEGRNKKSIKRTEKGILINVPKNVFSKRNFQIS